MAYRLGIDVGGTFTDLLLVDDVSGTATRVKTPSTPDDPAQAVLSGVGRVCTDAGIEPGELSSIMHGTTVATNAVLEERGARVGLVVTEGFREILHIARSHTPGPLAGWVTMIKPDPPASLRDTREARERISARGAVLRELDEIHVESIVNDLVESGVESLTVSLINSFANAAHERRIRDIVQKVRPEFPVTISSDVLPEFREYERTLTACMNSYVRPRVHGYVDNLQRGLREMGVTAELNILRSDAGLMSVAETLKTPIQAILSGPAGGVAGALHIARRAGYDQILTFDMGGTSTDVALCLRGRPTIARETEIGYHRVKVPSVNVHSVGSGGGSIAHVPEITGALRVGPQSAGADPGPAAYGRGGTLPTVTDANVVVGYLPSKLLGGEMELDVDQARAAVETVAGAIGLGVTETAMGILDLVNEQMAGALRVVSVERGHDPRDFALVGFGGAGPAHANAVAKLMGTFPVVIPPGPGLLCAAGDLVSDYRSEFAQTFIRLVGNTGGEELAGIFNELSDQALAWMEREEILPERRVIDFNVDMRYDRQGYEIPVDVTPAELLTEGAAALDRFHALHEQLYGFALEGEVEPEVVNLRVVARGLVPEPPLDPEELQDADPAAAKVGEHQAYFAGEWVTTAVYGRELLVPGARVPGPAIVAEFDSTSVILPGFAGTVDAFRNIVIQPEA